ncbi:hypothetical protein MPTK2_2g23740 [Marchantia polymorpha subsp. ruderalis]
MLTISMGISLMRQSLEELYAYTRLYFTTHVVSMCLYTLSSYRMESLPNAMTGRISTVETDEASSYINIQ